MKIQGPEKCIHCGKCLPVCPSYRLFLEESASPRGRNLSLAHGVETSKLNLCLLCERCAKVCPQGISFPANYLHHRLKNRESNQLVRISAELEGIKNFTLHHVVRRKTKERISKFFSRRGDFYVYASCGLRVLYPEALWRFAEKVGNRAFHMPETAECCGVLHLALGDFESAKRRALKFLRVFEEDKPLVVFCATCFWVIKRVYPLLFVDDEKEEVFSKLAERTYFAHDFLYRVLSIEVDLPEDERILYHLPCHLGLPLTTEENHLKNKIKAQDFCCGSARLLLWAKGFPQNYLRFWREKLRGKSYLLTLCTGCYINFSLLLKEPPVVGHWMEFLR